MGISEIDKFTIKSYEAIHGKVHNFGDISKIEELPYCDLLTYSFPCVDISQSGKMQGIKEGTRSGLLLEVERLLLKAKQNGTLPKYLLLENVKNLVGKKFIKDFERWLSFLNSLGYYSNWEVLNAKDYGVAQDRARVFYVGFRKDLNLKFAPPKPYKNRLTLKDAIYDLKETAIPALAKNETNGNDCLIANHEYFVGSFSPFFMSRNRVRSWETQAFTVQASGRHCQLHPQAPPMPKLEKNKNVFASGSEHLYRRLTVRECARLQGFSDDFIFYYKKLNDGYKMIGNAVPVSLSYEMAVQIKKILSVYCT